MGHIPATNAVSPHGEYQRLPTIDGTPEQGDRTVCKDKRFQTSTLQVIQGFDPGGDSVLVTYAAVVALVQAGIKCVPRMNWSLDDIRSIAPFETPLRIVSVGFDEPASFARVTEILVQAGVPHEIQRNAA